MSEKVLVGIAKDSGQVRSEECEVIVLDEEGWEEMKEKQGWTLAEQLAGVVIDEILPPEVLEAMTPEDPLVQPEELQIATSGVVVNVPIEPVRWFDERKCCKAIFAGVRPEVCSSRVGDEGAKEPGKYRAGTCMGFPPAPYAFDDPNFAWVYVEAARLATEEEGTGDGIITPGPKHLEEALRRRQNEEASGQA